MILSLDDNTPILIHLNVLVKIIFWSMEEETYRWEIIYFLSNEKE